MHRMLGLPAAALFAVGVLALLLDVDGMSVAIPAFILAAVLALASFAD